MAARSTTRQFLIQIVEIDSEGVFCHCRQRKQKICAAETAISAAISCDTRPCSYQLAAAARHISCGSASGGQPSASATASGISSVTFVIFQPILLTVVQFKV